MKILGIETSCDETAVCLIEASHGFGADFRFRVLGNALHSQVAEHAPWGGVFPNIAKREHAKNLVPLLSRVLQQVPGGQSSVVRRTDLRTVEEMLARETELFSQLEVFLQKHARADIDAIAVTHGPGLEPALWVGVNFARALSVCWDMPLVGVNHLEGHIAMAAVDHVGLTKSYMEDLRSPTYGLHALEFPALALLISGGHTELDVIREWPTFETLGETRDDAVGEAFDKVARMLGIPYPGGAQLSRIAGEARAAGRTPSFTFSRPMLSQDNFDFSFSGLKTEVRKLVHERETSENEKVDIALAFEDAATDVLVAKTARAAEESGAKALLIGGGVSANQFIITQLNESLDIPVFAPPPELATDNALMIALAGYFHAAKKEFSSVDELRANGNLRLDVRA